MLEKCAEIKQQTRSLVSFLVSVGKCAKIFLASLSCIAGFRWKSADIKVCRNVSACLVSNGMTVVGGVPGRSGARNE